MNGFELLLLSHGSLIAWLSLAIAVVCVVVACLFVDTKEVICIISTVLFVISFVSAIVFGAFTGSIRDNAIENAKTEWIANYKLKIYSINDRFNTSSKTSGSFFLGSGSISGSSTENHMYYYLSKGEFGGYEVGRVNSNICEVIEYDGEPKLIVYKKVVCDELILKKLKREKHESRYRRVEKPRKYVFYIPQGSVTALDYNVYLK